MLKKKLSSWIAIFASPRRRGAVPETFLYLLLLTAFLILIEISFFIQCNASYFTDLRVASDNLSIPIAVLPGVIYFLFAQLLVHFAFCYLVYIVTIHYARFVNIKPERLGISFWVLGLLTVLVANQFYFPHSKFAELTALILFNSWLVKLVFIITCSLCSLAILISIIVSQRRSNPVFLFSSICIAIFVMASHWLIPLASHSSAISDRPNIIIVGIDSLRPDFLSFFGSDVETPFLDSFLKKSTVFSEAITPLARTYPSWSVILTGLYPRESGIRFNLPKQSNNKMADALPMLFKQQGYQTIYATDETRFSNIDQQFHFDKVITPPTGLNDFLLGTLNDFPLSNLLVNTTVGYWLFPHSYANRPVFFTYQPDTFIKSLKPVLAKHRDKPVFLAVHFCLPHHPYQWANSRGETPLERYQESVHQVDQQVSDFFALLQRYQFLEHAIVVVLSDHGEALELPGDRITDGDMYLSTKVKAAPHFYPPSVEDEKVNQSAGHGTDVLGLSQYHSLLAFRLYGAGKQQIGVRAQPVSLLDIKPTLLSLTGLQAAQASGRLLCLQACKELPPRHLFLESDFSPASIRTVYPDTHKVLLEGIGLFQVDPKTARLQVKDEMGKKIIRSKQYADIYGEWVVALYPQQQGRFSTILVNLRTGQWTDDMHTAFAQKSPADSMLRALKSFYVAELSTQV